MIWVGTCNFAQSIWSSYNAAFIAAANKYWVDITEPLK